MSSSDSDGEDINLSIARAEKRHPASLVSRAYFYATQMLKRRLTAIEMNSIFRLLSNLPKGQLQGMSADDIALMAVQKWVDKHNSIFSGEDVIDNHELQKQVLGLQSEHDNVPTVLDQKMSTVQQPLINSSTEVVKFMNASDQYDFRLLTNPSSLYSNIYILADTRYRSLDNDGTTYFKWSLINSSVISNGAINFTGKMRNIIAMRVYPLRLPYNSYLDNNYRRVGMLISEFNNQSFVGQENKNFHFLFGTTINGDYVECTTDKYNDGYYRFDNPITNIDSLTLSFSSPLEQVIFRPDRYNCTFAYGNPTTITTSATHNLPNSSRIYFTNFTSASPVTDAATIAAMNSSAGLTITTTGAATFTVAINTTSITPSVGLTISGFCEARRIFIPIEITFIRPKDQ